MTATLRRSHRAILEKMAKGAVILRSEKGSRVRYTVGDEAIRKDVFESLLAEGFIDARRDMGGKQRNHFLITLAGFEAQRSKRGGARAGAGRPPTGCVHKQNRTVYCTEKQWARFKREANEGDE